MTELGGKQPLSKRLRAVVWVVPKMQMAKAFFEQNHTRSHPFDLQTFAPIATAHPYSARKFTCHVIHRACALSTKMNNDREDGHFIALLEFNDLGCSVTPTFLFRNRFYLQLCPHYPKMNKKSMSEVKKFSSFLSSGRKILSSFGCKAQETMVAKWELVL